MAELVDAHDLKSCEETHAGSIPAGGTKIWLSENWPTFSLAAQSAVHWFCGGNAMLFGALTRASLPAKTRFASRAILILSRIYFAQ